MAIYSKAHRRLRNDRLLSAALIALLFGPTIVGSFTITVEGFWPFAACSAVIAAVSWGLVITGIMRLRDSPNTGTLRICLGYGTLAAAITVPAIIAVTRWGGLAALTAGSLVITALTGLALLYELTRIPARRRSLRFFEEFRRFASQFKNGPIGVWRSQTPSTPADDEGCEIVFRADGRGELYEWNRFANESVAVRKQFKWIMSSDHDIQVELDDDDGSAEDLFYDVVPWGRKLPVSAYLVLLKVTMIKEGSRLRDLPGIEAAWPGPYPMFFVGKP